MTLRYVGPAEPERTFHVEDDDTGNILCGAQPIPTPKTRWLRFPRIEPTLAATAYNLCRACEPELQATTQPTPTSAGHTTERPDRFDDNTPSETPQPPTHYSVIEPTDSRRDSATSEPTRQTPPPTDNRNDSPAPKTPKQPTNGLSQQRQHTTAHSPPINGDSIDTETQPPIRQITISQIPLL